MSGGHSSRRTGWPGTDSRRVPTGPARTACPHTLRLDRGWCFHGDRRKGQSLVSPGKHWGFSAKNESQPGHSCTGAAGLRFPLVVEEAVLGATVEHLTGPQPRHPWRGVRRAAKIHWIFGSDSPTGQRIPAHPWCCGGGLHRCRDLPSMAQSRRLRSGPSPHIRVRAFAGLPLFTGQRVPAHPNSASRRSIMLRAWPR